MREVVRVQHRLQQDQPNHPLHRVLIPAQDLHHAVRPVPQRRVHDKHRLLRLVGRRHGPLPLFQLEREEGLQLRRSAQLGDAVCHQQGLPAAKRRRDAARLQVLHEWCVRCRRQHVRGQRHDHVQAQHRVRHPGAELWVSDAAIAGRALLVPERLQRRRVVRQSVRQGQRLPAVLSRRFDVQRVRRRRVFAARLRQHMHQRRGVLQRRDGLHEVPERTVRGASWSVQRTVQPRQ
mmetsp:Transcript_241/g.944  ORF Transcript_241/g.944 Transcript_241/m.944 type:complete len:234 (+) Transcript_241:121-822(+)